MKSLPLVWQSHAARKAIAQALEQGALVVGTSDTVLGLLANTTESGFVALNSLKGRQDKPYVILIASVGKVDHFVQAPLPESVHKLMAACWPGPLTLILPAKSSLGSFLAPHGTIALRVPNHAGLLDLLPHFEGLYSTSANLSGQPVPYSVSELDPAITRAAAYLVVDDYEHGAIVPSTIIDCTGDQLRVVRRGAYAIDDLEKIVGCRIE